MEQFGEILPSGVFKSLELMPNVVEVLSSKEVLLPTVLDQIDPQQLND